MKSPFYKREALCPHIPQAQWRAVLAAGCVQGDGKLHLAPARLRSNLTRGMMLIRVNSPSAIKGAMRGLAATTRRQIKRPDPLILSFCATAFIAKAAALAAAARQDPSLHPLSAVRNAPRPKGRQTAKGVWQQPLRWQRPPPTHRRRRSLRRDLRHRLILRRLQFKLMLKTGTGLRSIKTAPCGCWLGLSLRRQPRPDQRRSNCALAGRTDDGGHFIAPRFGGPPKAFNHFAQDRSINRGLYRAMEDKWAAALKQGKPVYVEIIPKYTGQSSRPDWLHVWERIGEIITQKIIPNMRQKPNGK